MQKIKGLKCSLLLCLSLLAWGVHANDMENTLGAIQKRGYLKCGVSQGLTGFSSPNEKGQWEGIDVDYCRALSAAIFHDASKVRFTPLSAKERFTALQSGEIDILSRNTTWTFSRDTTLGVNFVGTLFYDGQGFLVRKNLNVHKVKDLNGALICTNSGTTTELNVADFFQSQKLDYEIITFERTDETIAAYEAGRCDVYTTDRSGLAAQRLKLSNPKDHIILKETISKEPLGPVVRQGDDQFANIARWVLFAMVNGEELGVSSLNVQSALTSKDPNIQRLLGVNGDFGERLGLDNRWAYYLIKEVGNYQEVFERNVGQASPLKIERQLNALWNHGGILFAPPIR